MGSLTIEKKKLCVDPGFEYWLGTYTTDDGVKEEFAADSHEKVLKYFSNEMLKHRRDLARQLMH